MKNGYRTTIFTRVYDKISILLYFQLNSSVIHAMLNDAFHEHCKSYLHSMAIAQLFLCKHQPIDVTD